MFYCSQSPNSPTTKICELKKPLQNIKSLKCAFYEQRAASQIDLLFPNVSHEWAMYQPVWLSLAVTDEVSWPQAELSYSPLFIYEPLLHLSELASVTKKRIPVSQISCIQQGYILLYDISDRSVQLELGFSDAAVLVYVSLVIETLNTIM